MRLTEESINFIYENVNALFPLNFIVINHKTGSIRRFNTIEFPDHIKGEEIDMAKRVSGKLSRREKEAVYQVESSKKLRYMGFGIYNEDAYEGAIILGPYLKDLIPSALIDVQERYFYKDITVMSKRQQKAVANIVTTLINTPKITEGFIEVEEGPLVPRKLNYNFQSYEMNLSWIKEMYKSERNLMHYVSQGNKVVALDILTKDNYERLNELNRFPDNPIRSIKNIAIVLNTLLRKAIETSGVDEYFIHTISENVAVRIENSLTIRELITLMSDMVAEYCDMVNEYNTRVYSELISKAITYIKLNFRKDIGLASIAKELFIHPTYLAKKFKQETGKTLSEYVNEVRIKEAQFIIKATEFKIEDVAYYVGYNDKKYFSKTFKKILGMSPSEYRKYNKEEK